MSNSSKAINEDRSSADSTDMLLEVRLDHTLNLTIFYPLLSSFGVSLIISLLCAACVRNNFFLSSSSFFNVIITSHCIGCGTGRKMCSRSNWRTWTRMVSTFLNGMTDSVYFSFYELFLITDQKTENPHSYATKELMF